MAEKKAPEESGGESAPLWYISFADMVSLLMAMFVMLYSMSIVDTAKFQEVVVSLNGAFGVLSGGPGVLYLADLPSTTATEANTELRPLQLVEQVDAEKLKALAQGGRIDAEVTAQGLKLRFTDRTLFDPGSDAIRAEGRPVLDAVALMLGPIANRIAVEGHTDNQPIHTGRFPDNWALGAARANAVIRYLVEEGGIDPHRFTAASYGEYWPVVTNETVEGRAYNRRVEVVVLAEEEHLSLGGAPEATGPPEPDRSPRQVDLLAIPEELGGAGSHSRLPGEEPAGAGPVEVP